MQPLATFLAVWGMREHESQLDCSTIPPSWLPLEQEAGDSGHVLPVPPLAIPPAPHPGTKLPGCLDSRIRYCGTLQSLEHLCSHSQWFFATKQITICIMPTLNKYLGDKHPLWLSRSGWTPLTHPAVLTHAAGWLQVMLDAAALALFQL